MTAAAADREAIFRAEREATRAEADDRTVCEEEADWLDAAADDIDGAAAGRAVAGRLRRCPPG